MSDKRKVVGVMILVVVLVAIFAGTLVMLNVRKRNIQAQSVLGEMDMSVFPYIVSLPPVTGIEGEEYIYDVRYSDRDSASSDMVLTLVDAPTWLNVSEMKISGIPPFGSAGQYKLSIRISDGENSTMQENYILIDENAE